MVTTQRLKRDEEPTVQEKAFAEEYAATMDGVQSYRRAGYKPKNDTAASRGTSRLLSRPRVQQEIARIRAKVSSSEDTPDRIIDELKCIAFGDIGRIVDLKALGLDNIPSQARKAISSIKVKVTREPGAKPGPAVKSIEFKLWNKNDALDKLCKIMQLYDQELTLDRLLTLLGPAGQQIKDELVRRERAKMATAQATLTPPATAPVVEELAELPEGDPVAPPGWPRAN